MKEVINNCDSIKTISGEKYRVCEGCCFRCRHDCSGVLGWSGLDWTVLDWTGRGGMVMVMVMATVLFSIYSMHGHHCHKK